MKKIILGYDGSPAAREAIDDLASACLPEPMEALVFTVAEVWLPPDELNKPAGVPNNDNPDLSVDPYARPKAILQESKEIAQAGAELCAERFPRWKVQYEAITGSPGWEIVQKAHDWKADMVLVGAHSNSSILERLFFGTTASQVAAEASCSVRIARPNPTRQSSPPRVFVAVDSSDDSEQAVQEVLRRNWPEDARIIVGTVIDPKLEANLFLPDNRTRPWLQEHVQGARDVLGRLGTHYADRLQKQFASVDTHLWEGDPKKVLLQQLEELKIDCIFLGARGTDHGGRWRLGSVASAITSRASCTVEIIRPAR